MLVIGIGNEYRSDDGVGLAVAVHLQDMNLEDVTVITNSGDGADLLEILLEAEDVALVDAVNSSGKPGCVHRLDSRETKTGTVTPVSPLTGSGWGRRSEWPRLWASFRRDWSSLGSKARILNRELVSHRKLPQRQKLWPD